MNCATADKNDLLASTLLLPATAAFLPVVATASTNADVGAVPVTSLNQDGSLNACLVFVECVVLHALLSQVHAHALHAGDRCESLGDAALAIATRHIDNEFSHSRIGRRIRVVGRAHR